MPPGYLQEGNVCRRCRTVEGSAGRTCIVGDAAAILAGNRDGGVADERDAADQPVENDDHVAPDEGADSPLVPDADGGGAQDSGTSTPSDGTVDDARGDASTSSDSMDAVSCSVLSAPDNGSVTISGQTFGHTATYSCSSNYSLTGGSPQRTCQANGTWSENPPSCALTCTIDNSCKLGDACVEDADCGSGDSCSGGICLISSCAGGTFTTTAEISSLYYCREFNGDVTLVLSASGPAAIDLPHAVSALGQITIRNATSESMLNARRTVTMDSLTRVRGGLAIIAANGSLAGPTLKVSFA